jgi:hypothetical protein
MASIVCPYQSASKEAAVPALCRRGGRRERRASALTAWSVAADLDAPLLIEALTMVGWVYDTEYAPVIGWRYAVTGR